MTMVLGKRPLLYAVRTESFSPSPTFAFNEPNPGRRPERRSSTSSAPPVRLHLKPGQKGTKSLLAQYGDRLVCVRYRYDTHAKKRFKTVELIVAERDWTPPSARFADDRIVGLRVSFADVAIRDRVKKAGGKWSPDRRVWLLRYDRVVALGLQSRSVDDAASTIGCPTARRKHPHADATLPSR